MKCALQHNVDNEKKILECIMHSIEEAREVYC